MKVKNLLLLLVVYFSLVTTLFSQETRNIFLNQCVNTPVDSERMMLLDRLMLETGTVFPVFTRPVTNNEWYKYTNYILTNHKKNINSDTKRRLEEYIPDIKFEGTWNTEIYGRVQLEGLAYSNDRDYISTRYEERSPLWKLNIEASRDTLIGFVISTVGRNTWTTYEFSENKTNLPLDLSQDLDFRVFHKAYFSYQSPQSVITFQFGRDNLKWGVGKRASLFLSDEVPYFDFIKFVLWFNKLKFSMLYSSLTDYEPQYKNYGSYYDVTGLDKAPKSMLVQRIEYDLFDLINFGLSYMKIIYGRDPVLGDINPFIYQHNLFKEYQNSLASFDVVATPLRGVQLYGEVTSDEINYSNDFKIDNPTNPTSVSYQAGVNLYLSGFYFNTEYIFVAPFMYNHYHFLGRAIEIDGLRDYRSPSRSLRYMALGHWLQPDSRNLGFSFDKSISPWLSAGVFGEIRKNGEINILTPYPQTEYIRQDSPTGIVETVQILGMNAHYKSNRYIVKWEIKNISVTNFNHTVGDDFSSWEFILSAGVKFEIL